MYFERGAESGVIEVSSFGYTHVPDVDNAGSYIRSLLNNMLDVQASINDNIFGAENAVNTADGEVCVWPAPAPCTVFLPLCTTTAVPIH